MFGNSETSSNNKKREKNKLQNRKQLKWEENKNNRDVSVDISEHFTVLT